MRLALAILPVSALASAACGNAPDTVQGGEPLYAAPVDCTPSTSACTTWTHLYACYFGPSAANGGCAGSGTDCHASEAGTGATASGYVCGSTQASCWNGITSSYIQSLAPLVDPQAKMANGLLEALYKEGTKPGGTTANNMPTTSFGGPPVVTSAWPGFSPADRTCIETWVGGGAPNN